MELVERLRQDALLKGDDADKAKALRETVSRIDPGLVHRADLARLRKHPWNLKVRIAVLHHPVSPLPSGTEIAHYMGLINAADVKATLMDREFSLVLHGHAHAGWFGQETWPGLHGDRCLRIAAAPSLSSQEVQERHGYNEILVWRERNDAGDLLYLIRVTRVVRKGGSWLREAPPMGPFAPCQ